MTWKSCRYWGSVFLLFFNLGMAVALFNILPGLTWWWLGNAGCFMVPIIMNHVEPFMLKRHAESERRRKVRELRP